VTTDFAPALADYVARQRWYAGKGHHPTIVGVVRLPWVGDPGTEPHVRVELVTVASGGRELVYSVPLAYYTSERPHLDHAYVGDVEDAAVGRMRAYDALHDRLAIGALLRGFDSPGGGGLVHRATGRLDLPANAPSLMLTGEQSNTSVLLGDELLLKVFRTVTPGRNPDIEIHAALAATGSDVVARLRGWVETDPAVAPGAIDLVMVQEFLHNATDGWQYARASVRDLLIEGDLHADEVGGDFAGEAERLGATVARLHADLAAALPTATWRQPEVTALVSRLQRRLDAAVARIPELAEHAEPLQRAYADLASLTEVPVQRVHGDLHLGQSLRTVEGWRIIDFEGEPAKPLGERSASDSPVRDVAGMLRSFDYAAHSVALPEAEDHQRAHRAAEWAERNRTAFRAGYTAQAGGTVPEVLLRAYEVDKAVYEAVYEADNRPSWLSIPLAALRRLAAESAT